MNRYIAMLAACTALAGCKVGVDAEIFAADVLDAMDGANDITTPMLLSFEVSGDNGCVEARDGLTGPLAAAFGTAEYVACERRGFDTFADFRVTVDLVHEIENGTNDSDQPIFVGVFAEDDGATGIYYFFNRSAFQTLQASIPEEMTRFHPEPELLLSATLSNDLREAVQITASDAFADGRPVTGTQTFDLDRRGEVAIDLSNVSNAALGLTDGWVLIARMGATAQQ